MEQLESMTTAARVASEVQEGFYDPRVADLMTREVITLSEEDDLKILRDLLDLKAIRHVPVTRDGDYLVGLVTQRDFLTVAVSKLAHEDPQILDAIYSSLKIKDVMGKKVRTISPDAPLSDAARLMTEHKFGCLPVVEDGRLVGIITESDFVKAFLEWSVKFRG